MKAATRNPFSATTREVAGATAVTLVVGVLGMTLALQGWRSRVTDDDLLLAVDGAHRLITEGRIPDRGPVTTYSSYGPPGSAWLTLPGILAFADTRLFEVAGSAALYFGSLVGIFLLARAMLGTRPALVSVVLYGLSEPALSLANTVWPRGHPFFCVWMAYWTLTWVRRGDGRYFAAAVVTWAAGMYVHVELAPAILILFAAWLARRPPVSVRALAASSVMVIVLWLPYLRLEAGRGFRDIRSLALFQDIYPEQYRQAWCDPVLTMQRWGNRTDAAPAADGGPSQGPAHRLTHAVATRGWGIASGLQANLGGFSPVVRVTLLGCIFCGMLLCWAARRRTGESEDGRSEDPTTRWPTAAGAVLLVAAVLLNEFVVARYLSPDLVLARSTKYDIRLLQAALAVGGACLLARGPVTRLASRLSRLLRPGPADPDFLAMALGLPWLLLALLAEPGRGDRFVWLWPLQIVVLAAFWNAVLGHPVLPRAGRWAGFTILAGTVMLNPITAASVRAWSEQGWSGTDADALRVTGFLRDHLRREGRQRAAIGYQVFVDGPKAAAKAVDPLSKVGAQLDFLLKYQYGIANTDQCAEGVSPDDEFRIAETRPRSPEAELRFYTPQWSRSFRLVQRAGNYELYRRDNPSGNTTSSPGRLKGLP